MLAARVSAWCGVGAVDPGEEFTFDLFVATLLYCVASLMASEAIDLHLYYTGSLFDVPLVAAMAWFMRIGFLPYEATDEDSAVESLRRRGYGIWKARLAMVAVFVTPLMVGWAEFGGTAPQSVRTYRLLLTVAVMLVMGALVFVKQHLLDQELLSLLRSSRNNLDEMCRLKDELENKEHSLRWHSLELQRKNLELQEISFTDVLTGIWNRRYLGGDSDRRGGTSAAKLPARPRQRHSEVRSSRPRFHHGRRRFL